MIYYRSIASRNVCFYLVLEFLLEFLHETFLERVIEGDFQDWDKQYYKDTWKLLETLVKSYMKIWFLFFAFYPLEDKK